MAVKVSAVGANLPLEGDPYGDFLRLSLSLGLAKRYRRDGMAKKDRALARIHDCLLRAARVRSASKCSGKAASGRWTCCWCGVWQGPSRRGGCCRCGCRQRGPGPHRWQATLYGGSIQVAVPRGVPPYDFRCGPASRYGGESGPIQFRVNMFAGRGAGPVEAK